MKHGHAQANKFSPTYCSWKAMWQRCSNPKNPRYADYGGRGITVAPEWKDFKVFLADMGERPIGLTLERKENDGGYNKENCSWATNREQNRNQRIRKDNTSGIKGVYWNSREELWQVICVLHRQRKQIYRGLDFFEACAKRKAWERVHG